tara:strand:+ start:463 stop:705 length:243 start_codon:yes stop_codon:yes gene_type:complete
MAYINKNSHSRSAPSFNPQRVDPAPESGVHGLGDIVDKVASVTGIKKVFEKVSKITGKDCGCKKRKDALNKLVPFGKGAK